MNFATNQANARFTEESITAGDLSQRNLQQVVLLVARYLKGVLAIRGKGSRHGLGVVVRVGGGLDTYSYLVLTRGNPHRVGFITLDSSKNKPMSLLFALQGLAVNQPAIGPN